MDQLRPKLPTTAEYARSVIGNGPTVRQVADRTGARIRAAFEALTPRLDPGDKARLIREATGRAPIAQ